MFANILAAKLMLVAQIYDTSKFSIFYDIFATYCEVSLRLVMLFIWVGFWTHSHFSKRLDMQTYILGQRFKHAEVVYYRHKEIVQMSFPKMHFNSAQISYSVYIFKSKVQYQSNCFKKKKFNISPYLLFPMIDIGKIYVEKRLLEISLQLSIAE